MRLPLRSCIVALTLMCSCKAIHEEPRWIGLSEAQIRAKLGEPSSGAQELMLSSDARLHEYQSGLFDHCPRTPGQSIEVRELRWERWLDTAAVWLIENQTGEWVVVETLVWSRAVKF